MGGLILVFLLLLAIMILVGPAMRARARDRGARASDPTHEEVLRRLESHAQRRNTDDDAPERK